MTPVDAALAYAERGWPVFPVQRGGRRKYPLTEHGLLDATRDAAQLVDWWRRWPEALISVPCGLDTGFVALDIDVKDDRANGFDTLGELDHAILPDTPMVHTPSGGLHLHFDPGPHQIRNTAGGRGRGIGPGLDWRGNGGAIIVPSPRGGYSWDPHHGINESLAPVPLDLLPREPEPRCTDYQPIERTDGLSPYADAALEHAYHAIVTAPSGEQETTLHAECFSIGTLAGAGLVPIWLARRALHNAARHMRDHDPRRPWRALELGKKVNRSFDAGTQHPREARRHG